MPSHHWPVWILFVATAAVTIFVGFASFSYACTPDPCEWNKGANLTDESELAITLDLWLFIWFWLSVAWIVITLLMCRATYWISYAYTLFAALFGPWLIFGSVILSRKVVGPPLLVWGAALAALIISYIGVGAAFSFPILLRDTPRSTTQESSVVDRAPLLPQSSSSRQSMATRKFR